MLRLLWIEGRGREREKESEGKRGRKRDEGEKERERQRGRYKCVTLYSKKSSCVAVCREGRLLSGKELHFILQIVQNVSGILVFTVVLTGISSGEKNGFLICHRNSSANENGELILHKGTLVKL